MNQQDIITGEMVRKAFSSFLTTGAFNSPGKAYQDIPEYARKQYDAIAKSLNEQLAEMQTKGEEGETL